MTHKPFSHLMAEIATTLAPPQVANLAEAALGCFKDEMLHLLTKKRIDFQLQQSPGGATINTNAAASNKPWDSAGATSVSFACNAFPASVSGFHYGTSSFGNEGDASPWSQCTGSTCPAGDEQGQLQGKLKDENGEDSGGKETRDASSIFNSDCVLWDLPSDEPYGLN